MSDKTDSYIARRAEFDAQTKKCQRLVDEVTRVAAGLKDWRKVMFANLNVGFPAEIALARSVPSIDGRAWPQVQPLAEAISGWHDAKHQMMNAWHALSDAERSALQPPPKD